MSAEEPVFPVAFDELAMAEDLARLGPGGVDAFTARWGASSIGLAVFLVSGCWRARRKAVTGRDSAAASRRTSRGRQVASVR